jgi:anti-anti-sigma factor
VEISTRQGGDYVEVTVRGRLDAYWSAALAGALDELVRNGQHRIRLNLGAVAYMSSAGIRVLLKFYKQLQPINGALVVSNPSEAVKSVLDLAGLQILLKAPAAGRDPGADRPQRAFDLEGVAFEVYDLQPGAALSCRAVGDPGRLLGGTVAAGDCSTLSFGASAFGVGLGAFGHSFEDCRGRFGEFLAAAGAATFLPTDGSNVPDYVVAAGALVPEVRALYALVCDGPFRSLARFEHSQADPSVALTQLARAALHLAAADTAGVVMIAESAGLVGAALRRSPAAGAGAADFFDHPGVRDHLSYSPERSHARSLALVAGVVTRSAQPPLASFVRPLGDDAALRGHFHAAAFSYQPLRKGEIELQSAVAGLFESETVQGVMHLIGDDRQIAGAGESEFLRGALWVGPIAEVTAQ